MQGLNDDKGNLELLRVLAAVAWADGEVSPAESRFLEDLCRELGLGAQEHAQIHALLERPISIEEFEGFVRAFRENVEAPARRKELLQRVEELAGPERGRSPQEQDYLRRLHSWLSEGTEERVPRRSTGLRSWMESARREMARAASGLPVGPVASALEAALHGRESAPGLRLTPDRRRYVTLFGALLYRVLRADGVEHPSEKESLRAILSERFGFTEDELGHVLDLVEATAAKDADRQRLCAEFNRISEMGGRLRLLEALFALGLSDGSLSAEEEREIRLIANYLWIETQEYVRVRHEALASARKAS